MVFGYVRKHCAQSASSVARSPFLKRTAALPTCMSMQMFGFVRLSSIAGRHVVFWRSGARCHATGGGTTSTSRSKSCFFFLFSGTCLSLLAWKTVFRWEFDRQLAAITDAGLPIVYDVKAIEAFWTQYPLIATMRALDIAAEFAPFLLRFARFYREHCWQNGILREIIFPNSVITGRPSDSTSLACDPDRRKAKECDEILLGVEFRELLQMLGPTFIKFGQMLSIRPDLIPPSALKELQRLCDGVPPFPLEQALAVVRSELSAPCSPSYAVSKGAAPTEHMNCDKDVVEAIAAEMSRVAVPIAAASLGQVYRIRLNKQILGVGCESEFVDLALKVQRPDMLRSVSLDLFLLRRAAQAAQYLCPNQPFFTTALVDAFANASYLELDYLHEAAAQIRFASELVPRIGANVLRVPGVWQPLTRRKVLVSDFVIGEKMANSSPETIRRLVPVGVRCYLTQLLETHDFHSDPHPGNLLVDEESRLVLIDFGLTASIEKPDAAPLARAILHMITSNIPALLQDLMSLGFLPPDYESSCPSKYAELQQDFERVFAEAKAQAIPYLVGAGANAKSSPLMDVNCSSPEDVEGAIAAQSFGGQKARRKQLAAVSKDLNHIFFDYPFTVPSYFALITRALITLEGIALVGDDNFDLFSAAFGPTREICTRVFGLRTVAKALNT